MIPTGSSPPPHPGGRCSLALIVPGLRLPRASPLVLPKKRKDQSAAKESALGDLVPTPKQRRWLTAHPPDPAVSPYLVAGFDETGLRVAGALHWVHCARTGKYTLITCHTKRGREGIDDAGVLARFAGVAVHDAWAPYDAGAHRK